GGAGAEAAGGAAGRAGPMRREGVEVGAGGQVQLAAGPRLAGRSAAALLAAGWRDARGTGHDVHFHTLPEPAPAPTTDNEAKHPVRGGCDYLVARARPSSARSLLVAAGLTGDWGAMCFPLVISSSGIVTGWLSLGIVRLAMPITEACHVERALKAILLVAAILETPVILGLAKLLLPPTFALSADVREVKWWIATLPVLIGLWGGLVIGVVTEYFTSHSYAPVREIAESQKTSAATGIIFGLALGYMSCVIPTLVLAGTIVSSYILCGMYGVALAALGMLSTLTMGLTIDGFGPICDNAGGLAEMANLPAEVRERTDALDAAGNTTAAVGKGFAIGSAALVSLALFGAFCEQAPRGLGERPRPPLPPAFLPLVSSPPSSLPSPHVSSPPSSLLSPLSPSRFVSSLLSPLSLSLSLPLVSSPPSSSRPHALLLMSPPSLLRYRRPHVPPVHPSRAPHPRPPPAPAPFPPPGPLHLLPCRLRQQRGGEMGRGGEDGRSAQGGV
ncbi:unnamed protein product, partial [Prorocentrum cordatum]